MTKIRIEATGRAIDLPYLHVVTARGRRYIYFRAKDFPKVRLFPEAPDFLQQYEGLVNEVTGQSSKHAADSNLDAQTIAWLVMRYKASADFKRLSASSQTQYRRFLDLLASKAGKMPYQQMPRAFVKGLRDQFDQTPAMANQCVKVISTLFAWAIDADLTESNPARGIKPLAVGDGHQPWREGEIESFRATWKIGTLQRTTFELLLGTVQRGSDVIRMQRSHLSTDLRYLEIVQKKTKTRVKIPLPDATRDALRVWLASHQHLSILVTSTGRGLRGDNYRLIMRSAMNEAGLPHRTLHGLRYTGARRLLETGSSLAVVASFTGHRTAQMAEKYAFRERGQEAAVVQLNEFENAKKEARERSGDA